MGQQNTDGQIGQQSCQETIREEILWIYCQGQEKKKNQEINAYPVKTVAEIRELK